MNILICTIKSWNIQLSEEYATRSGHNVKIVSRREELTSDMVAQFLPQFVFFIHWSWIIREEIYLKYRCIVFHMTDLPYGRGGSPLQNLIARGAKRTKISAIQVVKELDAGPVYLKEPLELHGRAEEIYIRAAQIILKKMVPTILKLEIQPFRQTGESVTFIRRKPEDGKITEDMEMKQIYDWIRMLDAEGYPKAFIQFGRYKLYFARASSGYKSLKCDVEIVEEENE